MTGSGRYHTMGGGCCRRTPCALLVSTRFRILNWPCQSVRQLHASSLAAAPSRVLMSPHVARCSPAVCSLCTCVGVGLIYALAPPPTGCTRVANVDEDGFVTSVDCVNCPVPRPPPPFPPPSPPSPPPRPPSPPNPPPRLPPPPPPPPTSNQVDFNGTLTTYDTSKRSQQVLMS